MTLFLLGCDKEPSLNEMKKNFEENKSAFTEIQTLTCELGKTKQPFSYTENKFVYGTKTRVENKIGKLDSLLKRIGSDAISFRRGEKNECILLIQYYVRGFAGIGITYDYRYNIENPKPLIETQHLVDGEPNMRDSFDIYLSDGWYLSFEHK